jgi:hypothetical protein
MDHVAFCLVVVLLACLWALLAPFQIPDTKPTADEMAERQIQIERANHMEIL